MWNQKKLKAYQINRHWLKEQINELHAFIWFWQNKIVSITGFAIYKWITKLVLIAHTLNSNELSSINCNSFQKWAFSISPISNIFRLNLFAPKPLTLEPVATFNSISNYTLQLLPLHLCPMEAKGNLIANEFNLFRSHRYLLAGRNGSQWDHLFRKPIHFFTFSHCTMWYAKLFELKFKFRIA